MGLTMGTAKQNRPDDGGRGLTRQLVLRAIALVILLALAGLASYLVFSGRLGLTDLTGKAVADYVVSLGVWGQLAVIGLMIAHCFIPFPAEIIAIAAGMCYGVAWGTFLTWLGAMMGAALSFWLARLFGQPFVELVAGDRYSGVLQRWADRQGAYALLISRFIPVIAFNLINYAAGLTRVSWFTFLWTTALGILPLTVLMVLMGHQMRDPKLADWGVFAVAGALLWLAVVLVRRRRGNPGQ
jgi:uncharacterized membrane protein YdjX (TVP38/TMEM64 family)